MRTRLFLTFLAVILTALVSNLIYERLVLKDFQEYSMGVKEDRLYLVLASVEGSYMEGEEGEEGWDNHQLTHAMHWGSMLGFDLLVFDNEDMRLTSSLDAFGESTPTMKRRIDAMVHVDRPLGEYEEYPLFSGGEEIGYLMVRLLQDRRELGMKERMFRQRGEEFLRISFMIAGGSAVLLAIFLSLYLTRPLRKLKHAAERVAKGDLNVRVELTGRKRQKDEVSSLIRSFNRMVESLEQEETLRRHLTSNIAHELRTPLTVLRSNLEAVIDGIVPCEPGAIRSLESEVERLTSLVRGIEDFTRAEAALLSPPEYEKINLTGLLRSITSGMKKVFEDKDISISLAGDSTIEAITDAGKLETALRNILLNAASHAAPMGDAADSTKPRGQVKVHTDRLKAGGVFMEISDTGQGIPEGETEDIFKRFYKGKDSEGTGLGLSIARELINAIGGGITAANAPSGGAVFRISLPEDPAAKGT